MLKNIKKHLKVRKYFLIVLIVVLVAGAGTILWVKNTSQTTTSSNQPAKKGSSARSQIVPSGTAGSGAKTQSSGQDKYVPNGSSSGAQLITPSGQILNTSTVSLSATSGPEAPNMESTVFKGSPGATVSIVASSGGADKVVATGGQIDASGEYPKPIDWNAKDAGLTPGTWSVKIKTTLEGKTAFSEPAMLTVKQ